MLHKVFTQRLCFLQFSIQFLLSLLYVLIHTRLPQFINVIRTHFPCHVNLISSPAPWFHIALRLIPISPRLTQIKNLSSLRRCQYWAPHGKSPPGRIGCTDLLDAHVKSYIAFLYIIDIGLPATPSLNSLLIRSLLPILVFPLHNLP